MNTKSITDNLAHLDMCVDVGSMIFIFKCDFWAHYSSSGLNEISDDVWLYLDEIEKKAISAQ